MHHRPLQQMGQQRGLKNLPTGPPCPSGWRTVPDGLAMATDQLSCCIGVAGLHCFGLNLRDGFRQLQPAGCRQRCTLAGCHHLLLQFERIGLMVVAKQGPLRMLRWAVEVHQHGIHTVSTGSAHQPEAVHRLSFWGAVAGRPPVPSPPAGAPPPARGMPVGSPSGCFAVLPPARSP